MRRSTRPTTCSPARWWRDRKSTRLNSSHPSISYAVFCLKKKKKTKQNAKLSNYASSSHPEKQLLYLVHSLAEPICVPCVTCFKRSVMFVVGVRLVVQIAT